MRRAAKRDLNERAIIDTWEAMGAYVESVSGPGLADTLVHHRGNLFRAEVKGAKRGLTKKQVENFRKAFTAGASTYVIRTPEDAQILLTDSGLRLRLEWRPEQGSLAGAARKEKPFRPGTDRARSLAEMCTRDGCVRSRSPGMMHCAPHTAEVFAPPPETLTPLPNGGALCSPPRSGAKTGNPNYVEFVPVTVHADAGKRPRVVREPGKGSIRRKP